MPLPKKSRTLLAGTILAVASICLVAILVCGYISRRSENSSTAVAGNLPVVGGVAPVTSASSTSQRPLTEAERFEQRYHISASNRVTENNISEPQAAERNAASVVTRGRFTLTFRAVSLNHSAHDAGANQIVAREVLSQIQRSPLFDSATTFDGKLSEEESPGTFTFTIAARVKKPLEL